MTSASVRNKHKIFVLRFHCNVGTRIKPIVEFVDGTRRNGYDALFVALAGDTNEAFVEKQIREFEIAHLAHTQATTIKHLNEGMVALTFGLGLVDGIEDSFHLFERKHGRQMLWNARTLQEFCRVLCNVAIELEKTIERAHATEHSRHRTRSDTQGKEMLGVFVEQRQGHDKHRHIDLSEKFQKAIHIALISHPRVFRKPLFEQQIEAIFLHQSLSLVLRKGRKCSRRVIHKADYQKVLSRAF